MRSFLRNVSAAAFLLGLGAGVPACWAQQWEIGVLGGGSIYNSASVSSPAGSGNVGFKSGPVVGAYVGNEMKMFGGERCLAGNILVRQRGTQWHPGDNVGIGVDHTLFALIDGHVEYRSKAKNRTFVSVVPTTEAAAE